MGFVDINHIYWFVVDEVNEDEEGIYDYLSYGITTNDLNWQEGYSYQSPHPTGGLITDQDYYPAAKQIGQEQNTVWISNGNYFCEIDSPFGNLGPKSIEKIFPTYVDNYNYGFYGTWYLLAIKNTNKFYFGHLEAEFEWHQGTTAFIPSFDCSNAKMCFGVSWYNTKVNPENLEIVFRYYNPDFNNSDVLNWLNHIYI